MATAQDCSIGLATESPFRTYAAPTRFLEFTDESLGWNKNVKQGQGLRTGARLARSGRRTVPTADGGGDLVSNLRQGLGLCGTGSLALALPPSGRHYLSTGLYLG